MFISLGLVSLVFSILMCVHVVRARNEMYWLMIILLLQPLGGVVYFVTMVLPGWVGGSTARRIGKAASETLDPTKAYRAARQAYDDTPTAGARARLAEAAAGLGRHDEAEQLYREAATGIHAEDPAFLTGRAEALVELGRNEEALSVLKTLGDLGETGRTAKAALLMGRAHEALGQTGEADDAYAWAAERYVGLEAWARYAAFLARAGRKAEADAIVADLDKRLAKAPPHFRKEAKAWRDFAAAAVR